ncbi:MFS transporter [Nonomuraea fastidiosa]|jgi:DHA1 family tetracycline resistance protein-like MFS transporter|uniref:MFS transporter n=1 Tax=Nonomuraea TaxID=83681 RepID=UPI00324BE4BE
MRRPAQLIISATVFVDLLGFTLILPALPFYATELGATGLWFGALMSAYSVAQLVAAPLLGRLSDRYGRRPLVLLALAGTAVSMALTGLSASLPALLACRVVAGASGGSISVAQAYLADVVPEERRTGAMAQMGASIGMAFVLGPALGGLLAPLGFAACAYAAAALAALNFIAALIWLPEPSRTRTAAIGTPGQPPAHALATPDHPAAPEAGTPGSSGAHEPGASGQPVAPETVHAGAGAGAVPRPAGAAPAVTAQSSGRAPVALLAATGFLAMAAFVGMETTLAFLGRDRYGWDATSIGLALAAAGVAMAAAQAGLVPWLARRWGDSRVAAAGAVTMTVCMVAVAVSGTWWQGLAAVCLLAAGHGLLTPTVSSLLAACGPSERRGARLGTGQSAAAAARVVGPALAGLLFDAGTALPYLAGAVAAALAAVAVLAVPAPGPAAAPESSV